MQYRTFGKLNWKPSALGFGAMRLPTTDGKPLSEAIDEKETARMLHAAIDLGVNYVDTAYVYHRQQSEWVVGRVLQQGGYRRKVKLATKSPIWSIQEAQDFDRILDEQLKKLQTEQIDFYLLHSLNAESWDKIKRLDLLGRASAARAAGKIAEIGFSFHDALPVFYDIVDGFDDWTFCQIQYNYMDIEHQAGAAGLKYAAGKGLAVVIMEPLLGSRLVNPPAAIRNVWDGSGIVRTPVDWALQWLWNQPEVSLVLSGMSAMQHVTENCSSAALSGVGSLSDRELALFDQVRAMYKELSPIPCTQCSYCLPCPSGVAIPRVFSIFNDGVMYSDPRWARSEYKNFVDQAENAGNCVACRECEEKCPQKIEISQWMPVVHAVLGEGKAYKNSYPEVKA